MLMQLACIRAYIKRNIFFAKQKRGDLEPIAKNRRALL